MCEDGSWLPAVMQAASALGDGGIALLAANLALEGMGIFVLVRWAFRRRRGR